MRTRAKRHWLWGAILFGGVVLLNRLAFSIYYFFDFQPPNFLQRYFLSPLFSVFLLPKHFFDNDSWVWLVRWILQNSFASVLVVTLGYVVVGMILGFLYGKVKDNRIGKLLFPLLLVAYVLVQLFFFYTPVISSKSTRDCSSAFSDGRLDQDGFYDCVSAVAQKDKDTAVCDELYYNEPKRVYCYNTLGYNPRDYPFCKNDENCLNHIAFLRGECRKSSYPDLCYRDRSEYVRKVSQDGKCNLFQSDIYKDLCA